jgi:group I intron endonuclease
MVVYKIVNMTNNKVYIGQTTRSNPKQRWYYHSRTLTNGLHRNEHLQKSWDKYGKGNFKFIILNENIQSQKELDRLECQYISEYDSLNPEKGYNIREGGSRGNHSEATKKKLSEAGSKYFRENPKAREVIRQQHLGTKLSEETKQKMRDSKKRGGEHHNSKLNDDIVLNIRKSYIPWNVSYNDLAAKYDVDKKTIIRIIQRKTWTHI